MDRCKAVAREYKKYEGWKEYRCELEQDHKDKHVAHIDGTKVEW